MAKTGVVTRRKQKGETPLAQPSPGLLRPEIYPDAQRFEDLYEEYRKAPAVTRKRVYLETMRELLPKLSRKLVVDEKTKGVLALLSLDGERKEVKP